MTFPTIMTGQPAPDATLMSLEGEVVHLRQAWQSGPALLVFLRHLG